MPFTFVVFGFVIANCITWMYQEHNFHSLHYCWLRAVVSVLKIIRFKRNLLFLGSGCWPRMASLKRWSASVTSRSLAGNGSEGTMRTASASTTQKWPARSPSSPGQTDRIPGSVASEWNCDKLSVIGGLFQPGLGKCRSETCSVTFTTSDWEHWVFLMSHIMIRTVPRMSLCLFFSILI